MKRNIHILQLCSICLVFAASTPLMAQVRGGNEAFGNIANADSWTLYDGADGGFYFPSWDLFGAGDPEIYGVVTAQTGLEFFADSLASNAAFVGDYSTKKIRGAYCDVYVETAVEIEFVDVYFISDGTFYYSLDFSAPAFFAEDGWDSVDVYFREDPWFVIVNGNFVAVEVTDIILSNISEIGVRVFTTAASTVDQFAAIDNFSLIPEVIVPELMLAKNGSNIELTFEREEGQEYSVMESTDGMMTWGDLNGYTGLTGIGSFTVVDPIESQKYLNVLTEEFYTNLPDVVP